MFYAYILRCKDDTLYAGSTDNLEKRLHAHNHLKNGAHYTKIRRPVALAYMECVRTFEKARAREAFFKRLSRIEKEALIRKAKVR